MSVRTATVTVQNAGRIASLMQAWRDYYCNGGFGSILMPAPQQSRISVVVDGRSAQYRAAGFTVGDVMILVNDLGGGYNVVFYDRSLNKGQGGFLPAFGSLSMAERTRLGGRRSRREQFLLELVTAAKPPQPARV
jgi:hypothetical protein